MHGRTVQEWDDLVREGHRFLQERAKLGRETSYSDLNAALHRRTGLREFDFHHPEERAAMGHLLGRIVEVDMETNPCMISSLVIYLNENDAGSGFYKLAQDKGLLSQGASKDEKIGFWISQMQGTYDHYRGNRSWR
jgi:hypothetical protein